MDVRVHTMAGNPASSPRKMFSLAPPSSHSPRQNHLLAALPAAEYESLAAHLKLVRLPLGDMLYASGGRLLHAYFPTTSIVSLQCVMESGGAAETASVGNEGMIGIALCMGGETSTTSAVVSTAGHAYRLPCIVLKQEFSRGGLLQHLMLRYTQALIAQMVQTAACNRYHTVEQQLARWLLSTLDRGLAGELVMTQELVANMLGVRRESISEAAGRLQNAGFISCRRGHITVIDRAGLKACACECYAAAKTELDRLLGGLEYRQGAITAEHECLMPAERLGTKCVVIPRLAGGTT